MSMRKNNTKQVIDYGSKVIFTIQELIQKNPTIKTITLRDKLNKDINRGKVSDLGVIPGNQGRPQKVFSMSPVTKIVVDLAESKGIVVHDSIKDSIIMSQVKSNSPKIPNNVAV